MYNELTNTLIELSKDLNQPNRFYADQELEKLQARLDEYLVVNTNNLEEFSLDSINIRTGYGDVKIPYHFIKPIDENNPYIMWITGNMSEINYALKDKIPLRRVIESDQGTVSFSIRIANSMSFRRRIANSEYVLDEEYIVKDGDDEKNIIRTDFGVVDYLPYFYTEEEYNKHMLEPQSTFKDSLFWSYRSAHGSIWARKLEDGTYKIQEFDVDGRPEKSEIRTGSSLYSAYNEYMIEKGYFKDNEQKINRNHK